MLVPYIKDLKSFFKVVSNCEGKVVVVTDKGDKLNLKSKLSQFVAITNIFRSDEPREVKIIAYKPEDKIRIFNYFQAA